MSGTKDPNDLEPNRLAKDWLVKAGRRPQPGARSLHLLSLASWGLEHGLKASSPLSPSQPLPESLEQQVHLLLGDPEAADWLLNNPDGPDQEEQLASLSSRLKNAHSPLAAARVALETVYDRMAAGNASSQD